MKVEELKITRGNKGKKWSLAMAIARNKQRFFEKLLIVQTIVCLVFFVSDKRSLIIPCQITVEIQFVALFLHEGLLQPYKGFLDWRTGKAAASISEQCKTFDMTA